MERTIEEVVVADGLVSPEDVARATRHAGQNRLPVAAVLVSWHMVSEFDLADALSRALDIPVVDLAGGELEDEAIRLVPADVAERYILIPVGVDIASRVLRVALLNPLDRGAIAEIEEATALTVAPMVATMSSVDNAIQRYYRRATTKVVARPSARGAPRAAEQHDRGFGDATTKMPAQDAEPSAPGTVPSHSLEEEASVEARLRALVLALEDRGLLTHADFLFALRRVLDER